MATCPFCSDTLLRHVRSRQTYWLCRHCRLEISETELRSTISLSPPDTLLSPASKVQAEEGMHRTTRKKSLTNIPTVQI